MLRFASVPAAGAIAQTCRDQSLLVQDPYLWYDLYDWTQRQVPGSAPRWRGPLGSTFASHRIAAPCCPVST